MAGFDLQKLQRLIEERNVAFSARREANDRLREQREELNRLRSILMDGARDAEAQQALRQRFELPTENLTLMSEAEILSYQVERRNETVTHSINVNFSTFSKFIHARDSVKRLESLVSDREANMQAYAVVPGLVEAVRQWGFNLNDIGVKA